MTQRTLNDAVSGCVEVLHDACKDRAVQKGFEQAWSPPTIPRMHSIQFLESDVDKNVPALLGRLMNGIFIKTLEDAGIPVIRGKLGRGPVDEPGRKGYSATVNLQPDEQKSFIAALDALTAKIKNTPALQDQLNLGLALAMQTVRGIPTAKAYVELVGPKEGKPSFLLNMRELPPGFVSTFKAVLASSDRKILPRWIRALREQNLLGSHHFGVLLDGGESTDAIAAKVQEAIGIYTREPAGPDSRGASR